MVWFFIVGAAVIAACDLFSLRIYASALEERIEALEYFERFEAVSKAKGKGKKKP